jgi:hypothetical protein
MVTLILYVAIGIILLALSPLLLAAFGLYTILVVGIGIGGFYLAGYLFNLISFDVFIVCVCLFVGYKLISFLASDREVKKKPINGSLNKNDVSINKEIYIDPRFTSTKLEMRKRFLELEPAFSEIAKIRKIQKLNKVDQDRVEFKNICIERALEDSKREANRVFEVLENDLEKYLRAGVIKVIIRDDSKSDFDLLRNGVSILIFLGNEEVKHLKIIIKAKSASLHWQQKMISVSFQDTSRKDIDAISLTKLIKLIKKDIIKYLIKFPLLAEKIDVN